MPPGKRSISLQLAFKCSTAKTLRKSVKYVQGGIIQRKMSEGNSMGETFQRRKLLSREELFRGNCLGVVVLGELFRGNCPVGKSLGANCIRKNFIGGNCLGGSCPGGNYLGIIVWGAKVPGVIVLGEILGDAIVRGAVVHGGNVRIP